MTSATFAPPPWAGPLDGPAFLLIGPRAAARRPSARSASAASACDTRGDAGPGRVQRQRFGGHVASSSWKRARAASIVPGGPRRSPAAHHLREQPFTGEVLLPQPQQVAARPPPHLLLARQRPLAGRQLHDRPAVVADELVHGLEARQRRTRRPSASRPRTRRSAPGPARARRPRARPARRSRRCGRGGVRPRPGARAPPRDSPSRSPLSIRIAGRILEAALADHLDRGAHAAERVVGVHEERRTSREGPRRRRGTPRPRRRTTRCRSAPSCRRAAVPSAGRLHVAGGREAGDRARARRRPWRPRCRASAGARSRRGRGRRRPRRTARPSTPRRVQRDRVQQVALHELRDGDRRGDLQDRLVGVHDGALGHRPDVAVEPQAGRKRLERLGRRSRSWRGTRGRRPRTRTGSR